MENNLAKPNNFASIIKFVFPSIIMMVFMSMYVMVDGVFISRFVGEDALAGTNIIFPLIAIVEAIGLMLATGGGAIIAKKMGEGKIEEARGNFSLIFKATAIIGVTITIVVLIFLEPIVKALGATPDILDYSMDYLRVFMVFSTANMFQRLFTTFFVTEGKPKVGLAVTMTAGVVNIILDYVLLVPLDMGIKGAAYATSIGYMVVAVIGVLYFSNKKKRTLYYTKTVGGWKLFKEASLNGASEMVMSLALAIVTFLFNILMLKYLGESGVAAITVVMYSQFLFSSIFIGFGVGVAPLISYNYGSENYERLKKIFSICIKFNVVAGIAMVGASWVFAPQFSEVFLSKTSETYPIAIQGLRIFSISYLFAGINIFSSSMFTALGNGKISATISMLRTLVFIVIGFTVLPPMLEVTGIWLAVPLAELATIFVVVYYFKDQRSRYIYY